MTMQHPWSRFVAIGDSFTEGIGDPEPKSPGGHRGWADRVAEVLSAKTDRFAYANLAVRGKLVRQIRDEQVADALALRPDLVAVSAGGNDVIRPGSDPDVIAEILERMVRRLRGDDATVVLFTSVDTGFSPVFRSIRGKAAIYNENLRAIAQQHDCVVTDLWACRALSDVRMWAPDRLHLNSMGHHTVARAVLDALNVPHELTAASPAPLPPQTWRDARMEDLVWAKEYLMPWVLRRIRHQSSGDGVSAKRPQAGEV